MAWVRIDDQIGRSPKHLAAGPDAAWLWVCATAYCSASLTDGFVSAEVLPLVSNCRRPRALAARLVAAGLFEVAPGGWRVHDYLHYNEPRAAVLEARAWERRRRALYAVPGLVESLRSRDRDVCEMCARRTNFTDRRGPRGGLFVPRDASGPNTVDNIRTLCRACYAQSRNELRDTRADAVPVTPTREAPIESRSDLDANLDPLLGLSDPLLYLSGSVHTHAGARGAPVTDRPGAEVAAEYAEDVASGARDRALESAAIWALWREVCAACGQPVAITASARELVAASEIAEMGIDRAELAAAMGAMFGADSPVPVGRRSFPMFRANVGPLVGALRAPTAARPDVAAYRLAEWVCPHDPHCGSRGGCERLAALEAARTLAGAASGQGGV